MAIKFQRKHRAKPTMLEFPIKLNYISFRQKYFEIPALREAAHILANYFQPCCKFSLSPHTGRDHY